MLQTWVSRKTYIILVLPATCDASTKSSVWCRIRYIFSLLQKLHCKWQGKDRMCHCNWTCPSSASAVCYPSECEPKHTILSVQCHPNEKASPSLATSTILRSFLLTDIFPFPFQKNLSPHNLLFGKICLSRARTQKGLETTSMWGQSVARSSTIHQISENITVSMLSQLICLWWS